MFCNVFGLTKLGDGLRSWDDPNLHRICDYLELRVLFWDVAVEVLIKVLIQSKTGRKGEALL